MFWKKHWTFSKKHRTFSKKHRTFLKKHLTFLKKQRYVFFRCFRHVFRCFSIWFFPSHRNSVFEKLSMEMLEEKKKKRKMEKFSNVKKKMYQKLGNLYFEYLKLWHLWYFVWFRWQRLNNNSIGGSTIDMTNKIFVCFTVKMRFICLSLLLFLLNPQFMVTFLWFCYFVLGWTTNCETHL